ncbi:MAG TPA: hypothetical protein PKW95_12735 [bacterium]|nr:hypothetical protein [bacterium]
MKRLALFLLPLILLAACSPEPVRMINDFETESDLDRLTWRCPYWIERTDEFIAVGQYGLMVEMPAGIYPTLELWNIPENWSRYARFEFDVWGPGLAGRELFVRIDDQGSSERFIDRFEAIVELTGERQHVQLPLTRVHNGNGGRPLDLSRMERVLFYFKSADERITLYLDGVRLTR